MAATTLRHEYANSGWVPAALAMVALAVGSGYALAVGEVAGLYVALALTASTRRASPTPSAPCAS